jgi:hypothetical protein
LSQSQEDGPEALGYLRENVVESDASFTCPATSDDPEWPGTSNTAWDKAISYNYDAGSYTAEPMRVIAADTGTGNHADDGSVALFADYHAKWVPAESAGVVKNDNVAETDNNIYGVQVSNSSTDCYLVK